jgi:tetratricopeptide (TPR) repeat protein
MSTAAAVQARWLFGPVSDLLFGCGVLYLAVFLAFAVGGAPLREAQPSWLFAFVVLALSVPHYGATLVRAYEKRADRHAYALFTVGATILVVLAFLAGTRWAIVGSILFTLYLTWSPWHYTGQNYGISLMFLRRQGIDVDPQLKRWIHASFVLSFALAAFIMHGAKGADAAVPGAYLSAQAQVAMFRSLGIPAAVTAWAVPALTVAYVAAVVASGAALLRRAPARTLLPFGTLLLSQALWFPLPFLAQYRGSGGPFDPLNPQFAIFYALWIALAHATQYLWITAYYARTGAGDGTLRFYAKALAAGSAAFLVPWLLVAPGSLGRVAQADGLLAPAGASALVLLAVVNLHHFILDGAIWKLRHHRVARVLIRAASAPSERDVAGRPLVRKLVWTGCGAALLASVAYTVDSEVLFPAALRRGDYEGARAIADRLAFFGQDQPGQRALLGDAWVNQRRFGLAVEQYQRSVALAPHPVVHLRIAQIHASAGRWTAALAAYEAGLALAPDSVPLLRGAAAAAARLGRTGEARAFVERADQAPAAGSPPPS